MAYIRRDKVKIHISKKGERMITIPFMNRNGIEDLVYIPIPDGYQIIHKNEEYGDVVEYL